jgi:two-component system NarL family response regulator
MILIASAASDLLAKWEQVLEGLSAVVAVRQFDSLKQVLARVGPDVLLLLDLELPGLEGARGVAALRRAHPGVRVIAFSNVASDELEIALFKLGVRGCASRMIEPQLLKRIAIAVGQGELWIRRAITPRLIDELGARFREDVNRPRTTHDELTLLTERERQIVKLIGSGESNKQIARELCITERTVKAHLTGIFRKLGVADRVRLALRVAARPDYQSERVG